MPVTGWPTDEENAQASAPSGRFGGALTGRPRQGRRRQSLRRHSVTTYPPPPTSRSTSAGPRRIGRERPSSRDTTARDGLVPGRARKPEARVLGDGEEPPGFHGQPCRSSPPSGHRAPSRGGVNGFARCRPGRAAARPRLADCPVSTSGSAAAAVPARLEASVSTPAAGAAAETAVATTLALRLGRRNGRGELVDVGQQTSGPARAPDPGWRWILAGYRETVGARGRGGGPGRRRPQARLARRRDRRAPGRRRRGRQSAGCSSPSAAGRRTRRRAAGRAASVKGVALAEGGGATVQRFPPAQPASST